MSATSYADYHGLAGRYRIETGESGTYWLTGPGIIGPRMIAGEVDLDNDDDVAEAVEDELARMGAEA